LVCAGLLSMLFFPAAASGLGIGPEIGDPSPERQAADR
jgi:hypothetical protein